MPVKALLPYLNEQMLYQFHWGYEKQGRRLGEFLAWAQKELRPVLAGLVAEAEAERIFAPQAAYGYFKAAGEGNDDRPVRRGGHRRARPLRACRARPRRAACASPTSCATSTSPSATCSACRW